MEASRAVLDAQGRGLPDSRAILGLWAYGLSSCAWGAWAQGALGFRALEEGEMGWREDQVLSRCTADCERQQVTVSASYKCPERARPNGPFRAQGAPQNARCDARQNFASR